MIYNTCHAMFAKTAFEVLYVLYKYIVVRYRLVYRRYEAYIFLIVDLGNFGQTRN